MTRDKEMKVSDVDLEWFFERLIGGIADRLDQRLREIVRDEMAKNTATGATASS